MRSRLIRKLLVGFVVRSPEKRYEVKRLSFLRSSKLCNYMPIRLWVNCLLAFLVPCVLSIYSSTASDWSPTDTALLTNLFGYSVYFIGLDSSLRKGRMWYAVRLLANTTYLYLVHTTYSEFLIHMLSAETRHYSLHIFYRPCIDESLRLLTMEAARLFATEDGKGQKLIGRC